MYHDGLDGEQVLEKPVSPVRLAEQVLVALGRLSGRRRRDRLLARLGSAPLCEAYLQWRHLQGSLRRASVPSLGSFDLARLPDESQTFVVTAEGEADQPKFRYTHVGDGLTRRLGRSLTGATVEAAAETNLIFGGIAEAYARCARTSAPHYDYARYGLSGTEEPVRFERLLLPMAEQPGGRVTHLLGVVAFSGPLQSF